VDNLKVAIIAGGIGSRLIEETTIKPKAMVEIGGKPILWHIMMYYSNFGFNEFVIALGYKGEYIKRWMLEYYSLQKNLRVNTKTGEVTYFDENNECDIEWIVNLVDTGERTQNGGRIKRLSPWLGEESFMMTWCDGLSNIDLSRLLKYHNTHGKIATLSAVRPPSRFGNLILEGDRVSEFKEKTQTPDLWINGAFFVLEPEIFQYIEGDNTMFEYEPLDTLSKKGELMAYRHSGFWQCMDTIPEKIKLENLWNKGKAPWKNW
jgi:glucose-1-phosphate cytidylyltransferase